jgi:hypothetical protein
VLVPASVVDPNLEKSEVLAGSESEKSSGSDTDSDPEFVYGFGPRHCFRMKNLSEKSKIKHLKEKNLLKKFFL